MLPTWQPVVEFSRFPQSSHSCLKVLLLSSQHSYLPKNLKRRNTSSAEKDAAKFDGVMSAQGEAQNSDGQTGCPRSAPSSGAHPGDANGG